MSLTQDELEHDKRVLAFVRALAPENPCQAKDLMRQYGFYLERQLASRAARHELPLFDELTGCMSCGVTFERCRCWR